MLSQRPLHWLVRILAAGFSVTPAGAQPSEPYRDNLPAEHPAIAYAVGVFDDPVSRLAEAVASDRVTLVHDDRFGYLPSLLEHLDVSVDTQALVFSKTSLQAPLISPRSPRAIYFSDAVAVGAVQGSPVIELVAFDPRRGAVFYTLDSARTERPEFDRPGRCLQCHQQAATLGVPGPYIGSVSTSATGRADFRLGTVVTDHRTPFDERWGGWYVTGTHGAQPHRGNAVARDPATPAGLADPINQNLTSLTRFIDPDRFLVPTSDLVALMTFEHQTQMINLLTRIGWEARLADHDGILDAKETDARRLGVEEIARYMLFADEAPLVEPVQGVSSFTDTFPTRGPRDSQDRSLRDFDLRTRLFRYPLSFMIYSDLFDGLPDGVRRGVYGRLRDGLEGRADGEVILAIVRETKAGLPESWLPR
ncbi:MAG: hypothetical protein ABGY72_21200 [bacterium]